MAIEIKEGDKLRVKGTQMIGEVVELRCYGNQYNARIKIVLFLLIQD